MKTYLLSHSCGIGSTRTLGALGEEACEWGLQSGLLQRKRYQVWNLVAPMTRLQSHFSERE